MSARGVHVSQRRLLQVIRLERHRVVPPHPSFSLSVGPRAGRYGGAEQS